MSKHNTQSRRIDTGAPSLVKQIKQFNTKNKIGFISIEIDELIGIFERRNFAKVTATTNDHEFESLEDIKEHKPLIAGFPDFNADGIVISFNRFGPYIKLYRHNIDLDVKRQALYNDLLSKRTLFDRILDISYTFLLIFTALTLINTFVINKARDTISYIDYTVSAGWLLSFLLFIYTAVRRPVRLKPKNAIGNRAGELIIGVIVTVVGGLILKKLFGI